MFKNSLWTFQIICGNTEIFNKPLIFLPIILKYPLIICRNPQTVYGYPESIESEPGLTQYIFSN
jgi:hypothetical protein